jgi:hypothetical protein
MAAYTAYTEIDPTQTLSEETQVELNDDNLSIGELAYDWADVLTVQAVEADNEENMDMLDLVIKGVGMFVLEVDDALQIKTSCQSYMNQAANAGQYDTAMPFSLEHEESGVQVSCSTNSDATTFLPDELTLVADACGLFMLWTDTALWHRPALRLSWGQLTSCSSADMILSFSVPSLGDLSFQCDTDPDEIIAMCVENGVSRVGGGGSSLPAGWEESWDEEGAVFYLKTGTEEWQWELPEAAVQVEEVEAAGPPLPPGWTETYDEEENLFYTNTETGDWQWEFPEAVVEVQMTEKERKKMLLEKRRQMKGKKKEKRVLKEDPKEAAKDRGRGKAKAKKGKKEAEPEEIIDDGEDQDININPDFKYDKTSAVPKYRQQYLPKMRLKKEAAAKADSVWGTPTESDYRKHFRCRQKGTKTDLFKKREDFSTEVSEDKAGGAADKNGEGEGDASEGAGEEPPTKNTGE